MIDRRDIGVIIVRITPSGGFGGTSISLPESDWDAIIAAIASLRYAKTESSEGVGEFTAVAAKMRAAATLLREVSEPYGFDTDMKSWSPKELEYEADYLTKPIPEEIS